MKITENAKIVLERRYLIKNEKGEVTETACFAALQGRLQKQTKNLINKPTSSKLLNSFMIC